MKPTNPLTYAEALLKAQLEIHLSGTEFASVQILTGESDLEKAVPCVVAYAASANCPSELQDFLRNYEVQCTLQVESKADYQAELPNEVTGISKHRELVQDVMDCLRDVQAIKQAAEADGHLVYDVQPEAQQPELNDENRTFQTNISFLIVMVFDLPPAG